MTTVTAEWTARVEYAPQRAGWLVNLYRDGEQVFARDSEDRLYCPAYFRRKKAEKVARSLLQGARELDRIPYRLRQYTYGTPGWSWTPDGWTPPPSYEGAAMKSRKFGVMRSDENILTEATPSGGVSSRFRCPHCGHLGDWHTNDQAAAVADRDGHVCPNLANRLTST